MGRFMRHNRDDKRFSRPLGHFRCLMANLTNSLFESGRIKTTMPKAKELRYYAERMITLGKAGDVASRRRAMAFMRKKEVVTKLFDEIAPKYKERNGGYTRILKIGYRPGDSAPVSIIELVGETDSAAAGAPSKAKKKKAASAKKAVPAEVSAKKKAATA